MLSAIVSITPVNTYFSSAISITTCWCIFRADSRYAFNFSLASQVFEIQKTQNSIFSVLNNILSVDKMQQVEYLPTQFDYKMFLRLFSTFLAEMKCMVCMCVVECKLSGKQQSP